MAAGPARLPTLVLTLLLPMNLGCATPTLTSGPSPVVVPGTAAPIDDSIDKLDFCFDDAGNMHLVWVVSYHGRQSYEVRYQRSDHRTKAWEKPMVLGKCGPGPVRIACSPSDLHVVASRALQHWISSDLGRTWEAKDDLRREGPRAITGFDVSIDGGTLLVTYLASVRQAREPRAQARVVLGTVRLGEQAVRSETEMFKGEHSPPISPRVLTNGDTLSAMYVLSTSQNGMVLSRMFTVQSADKGQTWSKPEEATPDSIQEIDAFDAAVLGRRPIVFFRSGTLSVMRSSGPSSWGAPIEVALPPPTPSARSYQTFLPSCASDGLRGRVVWIDTRFRRSDLTAQNPLGGTPWSDQPEWVNNDVMSLPLVPFAGDSMRAVSTLSPIRHTTDLSYASAVKVGIDQGSVHIVWAGRAKAGRGRKDAGEPAQLFHAVMPLE